MTDEDEPTKESSEESQSVTKTKRKRFCRNNEPEAQRTPSSENEEQQQIPYSVREQTNSSLHDDRKKTPPERRASLQKAFEATAMAGDYSDQRLKCEQEGTAKKRKAVVFNEPISELGEITIQKKAASKRTKLVALHPRTLKRWQPDFIFQNPRSPLGMADIREILSHPRAWSALDQEDRAEILAKFPDNTPMLNSGTPDAAPDIAALRSDDSFRYATVRFGEHIKDGRHDPKWLQDAWIAHERNRAGDFEEFEAQLFEDDWAVELPENFKPARLRSKLSQASNQSETASSSSKAVMGKTDGQGVVKEEWTEQKSPRKIDDAMVEGRNGGPGSKRYKIDDTQDTAAETLNLLPAGLKSLEGSISVNENCDKPSRRRNLFKLSTSTEITELQNV